MTCIYGTQKIDGKPDSFSINKVDLCSIFGVNGIICQALNVLDGNFSTPVDVEMTEAMRNFLQSISYLVDDGDLDEFNSSFSTYSLVPTFALCALPPQEPEPISYTDVLTAFTGVFATSLIEKLAKWQLYIHP